jgi:nitroreductase
MEFKDVIKKRKSVRNYKDKTVEQEKINYILECARSAPSWRNSQCWDFIVINDKEKIKNITKASTINRWLKTTPVIIVACGSPKTSGKLNNTEYYKVDVAIAMEHLVLAAADLGLGTCWIGAFKENKIKQILEIPDKVKIVALTPLGYPADKEKLTGKILKTIAGSKKRKQLKEFVHYNKW